MLTPDGLRLYFTSERPMLGQEQVPMAVWYVERKGQLRPGRKNDGGRKPVLRV